MEFNIQELNEELRFCVEEIQKEIGYTFGDKGYVIKACKGDQIKINVVGQVIHIEYYSLSDFCRAILLINYKNLEQEICEKRELEVFSLMVDCSRNAVPTVESLSKILRVMALLGYNELQLYCEDTYRIESEPWLGYLRGGYTKDEIKALDRYAKKLGIELVPCIQTLAHYTADTKNPYFRDKIDIADILLVGEETTYQFIDHIFSEISENFTSRKINIGMDEAHYLGLGQYLDKNGYTPRTEIMLQHLKKINEIASKYGFEPMMWSDMFFKLAFGNNNCNNCDVPEEIRKRVPKNVNLVGWEYSELTEEYYRLVIDNLQKFDNTISYASGACKWLGFTPHNKFAFKALECALTACKNKNVMRFIITLWGDDGCETSVFAVLPALIYASEIVFKNDAFMIETDKIIKLLTHVCLEDFLSIDSPDEFGSTGIAERNPSKYLFYNDLLLGAYDSAVSDGSVEYYKKCMDLLKKASIGNQYKYLFDHYINLSKVLMLKADLGLKLRKAYQNGDKKELNILYIERLLPLIDAVEEFYQTFKIQWMKENKPHGFDVQDLRIGGLQKRLVNGKERLEQYLANKISRIDELEETILDYQTQGKEFSKEPIRMNSWVCISTTNLI